ncbi:MAG: GH3 auxin-responsive promoter family protein [Planctomycetota bacterium]
MSITRTLLRPLAYVAGKHAQKQLNAWLAAHRRTQAVQENLLAELLESRSATAFGRDHGFERIGRYDDFRAAVPVRTYDGMRNYFDRVFKGDFTALLPPGEPPVMFSLTSGTTGEPKRIPVTERFAADMKRGWNVWGVRVLLDHRRAWLRPILQITSSPREQLSPTGLPCGAISGLLANRQKRIVRRMYATPRQVHELADPLARRYVALRCAVHRDVAMITTANPSSTIQLIETGREYLPQLVRDIADGTCTPPGEADERVLNTLRWRADPRLAERIESSVGSDETLLPRHLWNVEIVANWTGGTLGLYLPRLREMFQGACVRDIGLLASEGRFSIPLQDDTPAGVAEITGNFLEFIPAEQRERDNPDVLPSWEVERGQEYFLVVTNRAGLWRYDIGDRVRVVDHYGESPVFEFLSRDAHTANITGEKLTEHQVVEAMRRASAKHGRHVQRFVLQGRFADTPYYELRVEKTDDDEPRKLAETMDQELRALNIEYDSKRKSGRLGAIRAVVLPAGELARAETDRIRRSRGRSEQYKPRYLLTEVLGAAEDANT